jgi:hypothetical protein
MGYKSKQWNARHALEKWIERNLIEHINEFDQTEKPYSLKRQYNEGDQVPIEQWEITVRQAAILVERLGEEFLPIFIRAERELVSAKENMKTMERVRNIASVGVVRSTNFKSDLF